jgi:hypothetical protein
MDGQGHPLEQTKVRLNRCAGGILRRGQEAGGAYTKYVSTADEPATQKTPAERSVNGSFKLKCLLRIRLVGNRTAVHAAKCRMHGAFQWGLPRTI